MYPIIPDGEPCLLPGGKIGCVLLHGFTAMPAETHPLGNILNEKGCTVLAVRLAGHGTHPEDLVDVHWGDWIADVQSAIEELDGMTNQIFLIGQSMGGMIAISAAAGHPVAGVVGLSTPAFIQFSDRERARITRDSDAGRIIRKPHVRLHPHYGICREKNYPAYAAYPARILLELESACSTMRKNLSSVSCPVLFIQSRQDEGISLNSLPYLYDHVGSNDRRMVWLDGFGHSLIQDPNRSVMFEIVWNFIFEKSS